MKKFVILYVGVILGLALLYPVVRKWSGEKKPVRIYPALAAIIPADTRWAAGFDLERLKPTPLYRQLVEGRRLPFVEQFAARTGFDPAKSIYEIILVSNGRDTVALAGGKFAQSTELRQGMEPPVKIEGDRVTRMTYKGYTLEGNEGAALCFLNSATAIAGPGSVLRSMIDRQQQQPGPPASLLEAINAIPTSNQIWAVAEGDVNEVLRGLRVGPAQLRSLPFAVKRLTFAADVSAGLKALLTIECPDAAAAEQLAVVLKTAQSLFPQAGGDWAGLLNERGKVEQVATAVQVRYDFTAAEIEQLLGPL